MASKPAPLVSIVTPCLNSVQTLELTLSSVAAQTYPNIEHIVVDGGSNDGTVDLLQRFKSRVPLRWLSEPDEGMYSAINKGLRMARGDILSYLNSDDVYLPWSVETAVSSLLSREADLVFGDLFVLVKRGGLSRLVNIQFYPPFDPRTYAYEVKMGQPTVFWRRQVSDALGGFDEQLRYCGDFEYWLRTGVAGFKYEHVREVLAVAVEHEGALSSAYYGELQQEIERTKARYSDELQPRRFQRFRTLTRLARWRWEVFMLKFNVRRTHPSSWPNIIRFLTTTNPDLSGGSILPLFLPKPLPKSWRLWHLDPVEFERRLAELLRGHSGIAD